MLSEDFHPRDEELLLTADGELSGRRAARVRAHLASCWDCRARMAEIEDTIADFARVYRRHFGPELPPIDGARAQLKTRLAELAGKLRADSWPGFFRFAPAARIAAYLCVPLFTTIVISRIFVQHEAMSTPHSALALFETGIIPNRSLTPGAARPVAVRDVCLMAHEEVVKDVPVALRQRVFQEYGIANEDADKYEVDYLITPGLGGLEDIRNLWPEPNESSAWNSHVKDALEERLYQMVCSGKLDLPTAQREIAANWIAAYRKYFSTDKPLPLGSDQASNQR
jgi:anti-sigma factor RsiW